MPTTYRVTIYRQNIARIFLRSGDAGKFNYRISQQMITLAKKKAPSRSGKLARSHRIASGSRWGNAYQSRFTVENFADHADWVHDGTRSHSAEPGRMILPAGGPGRNTVSPYRGQAFSKRALQRVRGQRANPWLAEACSDVSRRYGAIGIG